MSCAGCDDCPQDAWHLHVTAQPPPGSFSFEMMLARLTNKFGDSSKIVEVTNIIDGGGSYCETIPTLSIRGTEAWATRCLFDLGVYLQYYGWMIMRLKIEGNAETVPAGRALYYEAHMKNLEPISVRDAERYPGVYHVSVNSKGERIYTVRDASLVNVRGLIYRALGPTRKPARIEACVLDTAPELDAVWLRGANFDVSAVS